MTPRGRIGAFDRPFVSLLTSPHCLDRRTSGAGLPVGRSDRDGVGSVCMEETVEPLVHFIHIPKAAGSTVWTVMRRQYGEKHVHSTVWGDSKHMDPDRAIRIFVGWRMGPEEVWYPETLEEAAARLGQMSDEERTQVRAIHGFHIEFGLHEHLEQPLVYFTVLRNPVDRVISHYYFTVQDEAKPEEMDLYEHISSRIHANLQTWLLSGPHDEGPPPPPDELLERAKRNLRACAVVGLTDRFDETALLLQKALGWRTPFYARVNVNRKRPRGEDVPDEVLRWLEEDNALDVALYRYAQELFEGQIAAYGPTLASDLKRFQSRNRLWQWWVALKSLPRNTVAAFQRRIYLPIYQKLTEWGGLRRLVPARFKPRVVPQVVDDQLYFDLVMGERVVGKYEPREQRWLLRRPFHLFVDVEALPGARAAGSEG